MKLGCLSEYQLKALLRALAGASGLELDEIVGAYARKGCRIHNGLLEVQKDKRRNVYTCGENPHFVARVISRDDL